MRSRAAESDFHAVRDVNSPEIGERLLPHSGVIFVPKLVLSGELKQTSGKTSRGRRFEVSATPFAVKGGININWEKNEKLIWFM